MSAATRTFAISELAEKILIHLPLKDLVQAQRINQDIKNAVRGTQSLRRHLHYFETPISPNARTIWNPRTGIENDRSRLPAVYHPAFDAHIVGQADCKHLHIKPYHLARTLDESPVEDELVMQPPLDCIGVGVGKYKGTTHGEPESHKAKRAMVKKRGRISGQPVLDYLQFQASSKNSRGSSRPVVAEIRFSWLLDRYASVRRSCALSQREEEDVVCMVIP